MLDKLKESLKSCKKCELWEGRENIVFSDGSDSAKLMLIGEAPGAEEDKTGTPFVGRAGKLLDEFLTRAGLDRKKDIYIANTVKCRPPNNRKPKPVEKAACEANLKAQIDFIKPKVIILCGATAMSSFIEDKKLTITKARGNVFEYKNGIKLVPVFHPSFLLRKHSTDPNAPRVLMLKDLEMIKKMAGL